MAGIRCLSDPPVATRQILHVALNNYGLLDMMGRDVPKDLYPQLPSTEPDRERAIFRKNLEWEKQKMSKQKTIELAERAIQAADDPLRNTSAAGLNDRVVPPWSQ